MFFFFKCHKNQVHNQVISDLLFIFFLGLGLPRKNGRLNDFCGLKGSGNTSSKVLQDQTAGVFGIDSRSLTILPGFT